MRFSLPTLCLALAASASAALLDRAGLTDMVTVLIDSIEAKDPYTLPLAQVYKATENSHPAALGMMTAWRTIDKVYDPALIAIDVTNQTAFFAADISEGNVHHRNILRIRFAVVDEQFTEIELFINRWRGDHGFSFSAAELDANDAKVMDLPVRTLATREELVALSIAVFEEPATSYNVSSTCHFTEMGWRVIDRGTWSNGTTDPVHCGWPSGHPYDVNARAALVIDEDLGIAIQSGMIPGRVFAYQNVSAFIPNEFPDAQAAQLDFYTEVEAGGLFPLVYAFEATGDTMEVVQFYDGEVQAMQINIYMSGPNATSAWLT